MIDLISGQRRRVCCRRPVIRLGLTSSDCRRLAGRAMKSSKKVFETDIVPFGSDTKARFNQHV
jgi:hypothetical protein